MTTTSAATAAATATAASGAATLLDTWETALALPPVWRALHLLLWFRRDLDRAALEAMSVGARNRELLALRRRLFGEEIAALATCPQCGETLDLQMLTGDLLQAEEAVAQSNGPTLPGGDWRDLAIGSVDEPIRWRPLRTGDLLATAYIADADAMRVALLDRCIETPATLPAAALSAETLSSIVAGMAAADPHAEMRLELSCPACANAWLAPIDIVTFLWREIDDWANRTLREVHRLASAYGWTQDEILALTARRRAFYLELIDE